jgi:hypothetical protein
VRNDEFLELCAALRGNSRLRVIRLGGNRTLTLEPRLFLERAVAALDASRVCRLDMDGTGIALSVQARLRRRCLQNAAFVNQRPYQRLLLATLHERPDLLLPIQSRGHDRGGATIAAGVRSTKGTDAGAAAAAREEGGDSAGAVSTAHQRRQLVLISDIMEMVAAQLEVCSLYPPPPSAAKKGDEGGENEDDDEEEESDGGDFHDDAFLHSTGQLGVVVPAFHWHDQRPDP